MEKAYDLKALKDKLVAKGLPDVENLAEHAYAAVKEWIIESAPLSETKLDDFAPMVFPMLDKVIEPILDGIDDKKD